MTTATIRTDADLRQLEQELLSTYLAVRPTPVLKETLRDLERLHANYFEADVGPGGNAWPDNAPATIARKGHGDILEDTLKLRRALTESGAAGAIRDVFDEGLNAGFAFGVDDNEIPYRKFHDIPGGRLPWRPHIGMTMAELDVIGERLLDNQIEEMQRAA